MDKAQPIDLSRTIEPGMPIDRMIPDVEIRAALDMSRGDLVNCQEIRMAEHTSTHVDLPAHVLPGGMTTEQVDFNFLFGPLLVLDVEDSLRPGGVIDLKAVNEALRRTRPIRSGDVVALRTGHGRLWRLLPEGQAYMAPRPSVDPSVAEVLVQEAARALVLDFGGPDQVQTGLQVHRILLGNGIAIVENAVLESVPAQGYVFWAAPLKIRGGTGSPIRAYAIPRKWLEEVFAMA